MTWASNSDIEIPVKLVLAAKIIEVSVVRLGTPSSGISPTIPHTSGRSLSYFLPLTRRREWTKSTPPAPETTASTRWSKPVDLRDIMEARKERIAAPDSVVTPTSMLNDVLVLLLLSAD